MKRLCTAIFLSALLPALLSAQDISELAQKFQERYGKLEKQVRDMAMVQEITVVTGQGNMVSQASFYYKGDKFRMDTKTNPGQPGAMEMETTILFDGTDMWMIAPFMGKKKISEKDRAKYNKDRSWQWWNELARNGRIVGTEKFQGRNCYIVEYQPPKESKKDDIPPYHRMWIDMDNLVQVKSEMMVDKKQKAVAIYSDFRKVSGNWEMPFKTEIFAEKDNQLFSTVVVKSVEVNKGVDDSKFEIGKADKKPGMKDLLKGVMPSGQ